MSMVKDTTNDRQPEEQTAADPADNNALDVVALAAAIDGYTVIENKIAKLKHDSVANVMASITDLENAVIDIRHQIIGAGIEAARRELAKAEITEAPAIIVRRSIGEAISRGDLISGQKLPGTELYLVTTWDPTNRNGDRLGRTIAGFTSLENLSGISNTFNQNAKAIGQLKSWHGHDGWAFDPDRPGRLSYEDARFKSYQDKSGFGLWGVPELPFINGKDRNRNPVSPNENMVVLSNNKTLSNGAKNVLYNTFARISGSDDEKFSQACTEDPDDSDTVLTVHFRDGGVAWDSKGDGRSCVRPVVPLELSHLIL